MPNYATEDDLRQQPNYKDAKEMRVAFGIPPFWKLEQNFSEKEHPLPDAIVHTPFGQEWGHPGGTNWFAVGGKGSGKSTLALWLAAHLMEQNDETVVWRGAEPRSEWLPYKHWATVYLPSNCDVTATWQPQRGRASDGGEEADLENVVREVRRYDGVSDLLAQLDNPEFAVVYPDPLFRGCNEAMVDSTYVQEHIKYVTRREADDPWKATPLVHWWVAFAVARVEGWGHNDWLSLVFDEIADLLPEGAPKNERQVLEKVKVMRKVLADSRKFDLSVFAFGQDETNVHEKIRKTFQWRVAMPDDKGNPCKEDNDRSPLGFGNIPMVRNFLEYKDAGYGICWKPNNFTRFSWEDIPDWEEDSDRRLKIQINPGSEPTHARDSDSESTSGGHPRSPPGVGL